MNKDLLIKFGILGTTLLFCFIIGELYLRRLFPPSWVYYVHPPNTINMFYPQSEIMPGITRSSRFRTNALGIRGSELPVEKSINIIAIGGSTTQCLYLDQKIAWPALVEKYLQEVMYSEKVWVGNLGKGGMASFDHELVLKHVGQDLPNLELAIVLLGVNDLLIALGQVEGKKANIDLMWRNFYQVSTKNRNLPYYKRMGYWRLGRKIKRILESRKPAVNIMAQDPNGDNYQLWRNFKRHASAIVDTLPDLNRKLEDYANHLKRLIEISKEIDVSLLFITQPTLWREDLPDTLN